MEYRDLLRQLLWTLGGLVLTLFVAAGLWSVLAAAGDSVGSRAARSMTFFVAILAVVDLGTIVVSVARRDLE